MYAPDPRDEAYASLEREYQDYTDEIDEATVRDIQAEIQLDDDME